ncbi:MAG: TIGR04086 family membrane protein [Bacillota bacterium]
MNKLSNNKAKLEISGILLGVSVSVVLFLVVLIVLGLVVNFMNISSETANRIMFLTNYAVVFIGGLIAAYSSKNKGWLNGTLVGMIYIILVLLLGHFSTAVVFSSGLVLRITIACLISALGGMIGINMI